MAWYHHVREEPSLFIATEAEKNLNAVNKINENQKCIKKVVTDVISPAYGLDIGLCHIRGNQLHFI